MREHHLKEIEDITGFLKAGGGCGKCHGEIQRIIDRVHGGAPPPPPPRPLTNIQKIRLIEETLEREIKPALKQDGGDIQLVDVEGDRVLVVPPGTDGERFARGVGTTLGDKLVGTLNNTTLR